MAKENIAKFFNAAMTDKALAEKLAALAAENGYDFTAAELLELGSAKALFEAKGADISAEQLEALKKALSGELSDDELGAAAAGRSLSELTGRSRDELFTDIAALEQMRLNAYRPY